MEDSLFNPSRLYETLKEQGLLPKFVSDDSEGRWQGLYRPKNNTVSFKDYTLNNTSHEFTHAVQTNLLEPTAVYLAKKDNLTPKESQFLDAYNKLTGNRIGGSFKYVTSEEKDRQERHRNYVQSLVFDRLNEDTKFLLNEPLSKDKDVRAIQKHYRNWHEYRTTPDELQAWGVGFSSSNNEKDENIPSHVNPSMTTELDILLSMYESLPKSVKEKSSVQRKEDIDNYQFTNLTEDPFLNPLLK